MKAEEIRKMGDEHWNHADSVDSRYMVSMMAEIAAQLAEVNESLKCLAHPLLEVKAPAKVSGEPIDIHGVQVREWAIGDRITIDGEPWVVTSKVHIMATLMKEVGNG